MKTAKFSVKKYESLEGEMYQAIGNLSRYVHKCGLTKHSLIDACCEPEEYADLVVELIRIGGEQYR